MQDYKCYLCHGVAITYVLGLYKQLQKSNQKKAALQTSRKRFPHYSKIDTVLELADAQTTKTIIVNFLRDSACLDGDKQHRWNV